MEVQYFKQYSPSLNRDIECKVYGHAGRPVLFIPCQDGRFFDFENFKMTDAWAPWLETGKVMVFSIDTMDKETWSNLWGDPRWRIERHEQWISYITNEMVPFMNWMVSERNRTDDTPGVYTFGCSLGASHAANLYLRRPDLFCGCLALSGIYTSSYGFGNYMDDLVYLNSPLDYLPNLPEDHPYMDLYRRGTFIICTGQGPWEIPAATFDLKEILDRKGIPVWADIWGRDCAHDWPWWYKQVDYFVPYLIGER